MKLSDLLLENRRNNITNKQSFIEYSLTASEPEDTCRLSFAQERMLFIQSSQKSSAAYHLPFLMEINTGASLDALGEAISQVVNHHPVLKSVFCYDDKGVAYQHVLSGSLTVTTAQVETKTAFEQAVSNDIAAPFDLHNEPGMRVRYYRVGKGNKAKQYLLLLWHQIAMDGWSMDIFFRELGEVYQSILSENPANLPELPISYGDYAHRQREYLQGEVLEELLNYWQEALSGYEPLALPTDKPRPSVFSDKGQNIVFTLPVRLSQEKHRERPCIPCC